MHDGGVEATGNRVSGCVHSLVLKVCNKGVSVL